MVLISVGGLPGSGTSTVCEILEERTGLEYIYAGRIFREMAEEKGMTLEEFSTFCEKDDTVDRELDKRISRIVGITKNLYLGQSRWKKILFTILSAISINKWDQRPIAAMEKIIQSNDTITFGAPAVVHVLKDKRGISHPDVCTSIAAQNFVLAAHALGLGTCYIGFIASMIPYVPKVKKLLGIEYPYEIVTTICVGYPKMNYNRPVARGPVPVEWIEQK